MILSIFLFFLISLGPFCATLLISVFSPGVMIRMWGEPPLQLDSYRSLLPLTPEAAAEQRPLLSSGLFCPCSPEGGHRVLSSKPPYTGRQADPTSELTGIRPRVGTHGPIREVPLPCFVDEETEAPRGLAAFPRAHR